MPCIRIPPDQIAAITASFVRIFPVKARLTYDFYDRLFQAAPDLRPMFGADLTVQREKLSDTLAFLVRNLDAPDILAETVTGLARRHLNYGARPEHFPAVCAALVQALQATTPNGLSETELGAWTAALETLSDIMIDAAWPRGPA